MSHYAIRISREYQDISGAIVKMAGLSEKSVWYEHTADASVSRTHVHGLLLCSAIKTDTVKNWIKKELNVTEFSKSDWAFTTYYIDKLTKQRAVITDKNYEKYIIYMTKGKLDPKYNDGFTIDFLNQCKAGWVEPEKKPQLEGGKISWKVIQPETPKEKKLREWELLEFLNEKCHKELNAVWDRDKAIPIIVNGLKEQKHCLSKFKVKEWVEKVQMYGYKKSFIDDVIEYMRPR